MKTLTALLFLALAFPASAGGPVVIEDSADIVAPSHKLTPGEKVALAILGLIFIGALAGGSGDNSGPGGKLCHGDPTPPAPGC